MKSDFAVNYDVNFVDHTLCITFQNMFYNEAIKSQTIIYNLRSIL